MSSGDLSALRSLPTSIGIEDIPTEILTIIFLEVANAVVDNGDRNAPPCMYLSRICGRWRMVAFACQDLWSTALPRPNLQSTTFCLSHCPSTPLRNIVISERYAQNADYRETAALVLAQWERVVSFRMWLPIDVDVDGEGFLERGALLPPSLVRSREHLVREWDLLDVACWEESDLTNMRS